MKENINIAAFGMSMISLVAILLTMLTGPIFCLISFRSPTDLISILCFEALAFIVFVTTYWLTKVE